MFITAAARFFNPAPQADASPVALPPGGSFPRYSVDAVMTCVNSRRSSVDSVATLCDVSSPAFPPPSYETATAGHTLNGGATDAASFSSKLLKLPEYVWKRRDSVSQGAPTKPAKQREPIDAKVVQEAMTLIQISLAMQATQPRLAADLYTLAVNKMIAAMPDKEPQSQTGLGHKKEEPVQQQPAPTEQVSLSDRVINAAVHGAVALKKSPIPGVVASAVSYAKSSMEAVDETYHIRRNTFMMAAKGVDKALEIDRQYGIHQRLTDAVCTGITAFVKAGIAYTETAPKSGGAAMNKVK